MLDILSLVPDVERLARNFGQATAPTFFLGAIAGFVSLMNSRMTDVVARVRQLNAIPEEDVARAPLKKDIPRLRRRIGVLRSGVKASLRAGLCATILLADLFVTDFVGLHYAYGAGLLFTAATLFTGFALYRFGQDANTDLSDADEFD